MVGVSSLAMEAWVGESDLLECVSWVNVLYGEARHLLDDELQKNTRLLASRQEVQRGARCWGIDVFDVQEKSSDVENRFSMCSSMKSKNIFWREGGLDETARNTDLDG